MLISLYVNSKPASFARLLIFSVLWPLFNILFIFIVILFLNVFIAYNCFISFTVFQKHFIAFIISNNFHFSCALVCNGFNCLYLFVLVLSVSH